MSNDLKQAGHFELVAFRVHSKTRDKSIDLKYVIHSFTINESMSRSSIRGSCKVYETAFLINEFPFKGEELVEIVYKDFFDIERTEFCHIYSITNVEYVREGANESVMTYELHYTSATKFLTERFTIMKAFNPNNTNRGLISDYVKEIFDQYYKRSTDDFGMPERTIEIEETQGPQRLVIPNLSPDAAIKFLSKRAFSANSKSQSFRFFETRDKFFFATNEYMDIRSKAGIGYGEGLVDPSLASAVGGKTGPTLPIFTRSYLTSMSAPDQYRLMYELIDIDFGEKVNSIEDTNAGAYRNRFYEIDIINGTLDKVEFDLSKEYSEPNMELAHNAEYVEQHIPRWKERYAIKDYASIGAATGPDIRDNPYYTDIINRKTSYFYHYNKNTIGVTIYGRNSIFAGDKITLNLVEHRAKSDDSGREQDKERSGDYFVESIDNIFYENTYTQKLRLSRSGLGK